MAFLTELAKYGPLKQNMLLPFSVDFIHEYGLFVRENKWALLSARMFSPARGGKGVYRIQVVCDCLCVCVCPQLSICCLWIDFKNYFCNVCWEVVKFLNTENQVSRYDLDSVQGQTSFLQISRKPLTLEL